MAPTLASSSEAGMIYQPHGVSCSKSASVVLYLKKDAIPPSGNALTAPLDKARYPWGVHIQRNGVLLRDIQRSRHIQTGGGFAYATFF